MSQMTLDTVSLYHIMTAINLPAASATKAPRIAAAFRCWRGVNSFHLARIASAIRSRLAPMNMTSYLPHPRGIFASSGQKMNERTLTLFSCVMQRFRKPLYCMGRILITGFESVDKLHSSYSWYIVASTMEIPQ